jgi:hypothetical protein
VPLRSMPSLWAPGANGLPRKGSSCRAGVRSQVDLPSLIFLPCEIELDSHERRRAEELRETFRLMRPANELVVLFLCDHHHTFLALTRDKLRSLGAGASKKLTETRVGGLKLRSVPWFVCFRFAGRMGHSLWWSFAF